MANPEVRNRPVRTLLSLKTAVFAFLISMAPIALDAQSPRDTKGTEFWVTFMENRGSGGDFETSDLRLYMSCDTQTTVRIHYTPLNDTLVREIRQPNVPIEININEIFGDLVELPGVLADGQNSITRNSFHITSDSEITLYGVNIRVMSADAFIALPDDVLTGSYIVSAWQNGFVSVAGEDYDRHSEFAIVATEDGTTITVYPSALLVGKNVRKPFDVVLDRGEVFFGQAQLGLAYDVTGTEIRANKPVAVFGGNERTSIPSSVGNFRDHLVEQMPPVEAWGQTAILTPHFGISTVSENEGYARIIGARDTTTVTVQTQVSVRDYTVLRGVPLELTPLKAAFVEADGPILVTQYEHSVGGYVDPNTPNPVAGFGDPFMMLIPPPEQYDTAYAFQSVNHSQFVHHYINLIVPAGAENSLVLDGARITGTRFEPVPGSNYLYAQVRVRAGSHYVRCDEQFGLCVYGFGRANSYGYPGGTLFRTLVTDYQHPVFRTVDECGIVRGAVSDIRIADEGIDSCYSLPATRNVDVQIDPFNRGADSVTWSAALSNPYQDGSLELKAIDAAGRSTTTQVDIPGFTLAAMEMQDGKPIQDELVSFNGGSECGEIQVTNYGQFPQTISRASVSANGEGHLRIDSPMPMSLDPGESATIRYCVEGGLDSSVTAMLSIGDRCFDRVVLQVTLASAIDTVAPTVESDAEPCGYAAFTFSEPNVKYVEISALSVDTVVNGTASITPSNLPAKAVSIRFDPIDFRQDMIVAATVTDRAGNQRVMRDTIGGFTLAVREDVHSPQLALRLGEDWRIESLQLTERRCDTVRLHNYGRKPLEIERIFMLENATASIPPSQLPIMVLPGQSESLAVCLAGRRAGDQTDTLWIEDRCGRWESVLLSLPVETSQGNGSDRCGSRISVESFGGAKEMFLSAPVPNPVSEDQITLEFGLTESSIVSVSVYDLHGEVVGVLERDSPFDEGVHRISYADVQLEEGTYLIQLATASGASLVSKALVRR